MYNDILIEKLVNFIHSNNGIADKNKLSTLVKQEFDLVQDSKVFYCDDFAIRFGWNGKNNNKKISNTVIGLSKIKNYDDRPLIFCIVTNSENHLLLINSTFLKKVSHSSKELRINNIRGSINCGDIMMKFNEIDNSPENFRQLYAFHQGLSFQDNLERLVESTNNIVGRIPKYIVSKKDKQSILESVIRAKQFVDSDYYSDLKEDLALRVSQVQGEIAIASLIDNVNVRGRVIEYLITDNGSSLKDTIIDSLRQGKPLPKFTTADGLGDYSKKYPDYYTETDIKTKVLFLEGNPKAYNIDKLLEFLSTDKSVYMIYLVGVDENKNIITRLCSLYDPRLISNTDIVHHWAGRNTRGVAQFLGKGLIDIINGEDFTTVAVDCAKEFLNELIER